MEDPELSWKEPFFLTTASKLSHLSVLLSRVTLVDFWIREKKEGGGGKKFDESRQKVDPCLSC